MEIPVNNAQDSHIHNLQCLIKAISVSLLITKALEDYHKNKLCSTAYLSPPPPSNESSFHSSDEYSPRPFYSSAATLRTSLPLAPLEWMIS